jgi:hypothetical protein
MTSRNTLIFYGIYMVSIPYELTVKAEECTCDGRTDELPRVPCFYSCFQSGASLCNLFWFLDNWESARALTPVLWATSSSELYRIQ